MLKNIFLIISISLFFLGCSGNILIENYPQATHYSNLTYDKELKVSSGMSMFPTFAEGNTGLLKSYNNEKIKEGQIVCYNNKENNLAICHRVVAVYLDYLIVAGDNNANQEKINYSQVRALLIGVIFT